MRGFVRLGGGFFLLATAATTTHAQLADPIPEPVVASGTAVALLDVAQLPDSGSPAAPARVNMLKDANDGSSRLFVNDQRGTLYLIDAGLITVYLDLAAVHPFFIDSPGLGTGFHSFAFHPDFLINGRFYTVHTETPDSGVPDLVSPSTVSPALHSVLKEWTAIDSTADVFAGVSREILRIEQPSFIHSLQEIAFNPTAVDSDADYGLLYLGQGDGGILLTDNPQGLDSPHGAMLRIDPLGDNSGNGAYGIPGGNPFADDADPATLDEIWAYGLRNPHRFTWDRGGNHKMLIGDIGQGNIEEVNLGAVGANYGWNEREGTFVFDPAMHEVVFALPPDDAQFGYRYPAAQYDHDEGRAIVGGHVYRGATIPELVGQYVFGDIVTGRLFHIAVDSLAAGAALAPFELGLVDSDGVPTTLAAITPGNRVDLKFGLDADGEIYVLTKSDGMVRRVVSSAPPDTDQDSVPDDSDNCTVLANAGQRDTDADGIGNLCDPDVAAPNDCIVNFLDLTVLAEAFFSNPASPNWNPDAELNADDIVNFSDLTIAADFFFGPPGPSADGCN